MGDDVFDDMEEVANEHALQAAREVRAWVCACDACRTVRAFITANLRARLTTGKTPRFMN